MTQLRHDDPNFTGFTHDEDACFFYVRGCEHTYWCLAYMGGDDVATLLDAVTAFYTRGAEAAREVLEGDDYVPPEKRPALRFRLVHETARDDDTEEPLAWNNELGWVDMESATLFTEEEAVAARLVDRFRVEEVFA